MKKILASLLMILSMASIAESNFSEEDITAFHNAVLMGDYKTFEHYLSKGMDIDQRRGTFESTPLLAAANMGRLEAVKYLLSKGANPDLKNALGKTAIEIARKRGKDSVVDALNKGQTQE